MGEGGARKGERARGHTALLHTHAACKTTPHMPPAGHTTPHAPHTPPHRIMVAGPAFSMTRPLDMKAWPTYARTPMSRNRPPSFQDAGHAHWPQDRDRTRDSTTPQAPYLWGTQTGPRDGGTDLRHTAGDGQWGPKTNPHRESGGGEGGGPRMDATTWGRGRQASLGQVGIEKPTQGAISTPHPHTPPPPPPTHPPPG